MGFLKRLWGYIKALFRSKAEDMMDPEIEIKQAIDEVFANRGTVLEYPVAFTDTFASDPLNKQRWRTFLKGLGKEEPELDEVVGKLGKRLDPYLVH